MPSDETADDLVLDTHVWYWLVNGDAQLAGSPAWPRIEQACRSGRVALSAISLWEICMLEEKQRIRLQLDRLEWLRRGLDLTSTRLIALSPEIAAESTRLPGKLHNDPADRIIVASARSLGWTLATRDQKLLDYAASGFVRAIRV